jgi:hypothetical protein
LRVTEQDVINEEMYEEEDDDLPHQYRRLTAHLQTGSADFNRRLAAYLTNNVAMRSALDQAITSSYAQQFPNAPRFAHNNPVPYPSPINTQNTMNPSQTSPSMLSPNSPRHPFRQSPYPMPGMSGYRQQSQHGRSSSMHVPSEHAASSMSPVSASTERKFSMPTPVLSPAQSTPSVSPTMQRKSTPSPARTPTTEAQQEPMISYTQSSISPLTTTLPAESQMLLGPSLDQSSSFNAMLMGNNDYTNYLDQDFFGSSSKENNFYPNLDGMNTTLAPSLSQQPSFTTSDNVPAPFAGHFEQLNFDHMKGSNILGTSDCGSGQVTPGIDGTWDAFINDTGSWAENAT